MSYHNDLLNFHLKFGLLPRVRGPHRLDVDLFNLRRNHMLEELEEFRLAWSDHDLPGQADALVDLVYVAIGTAVVMDLPFDRLWFAVHQANMQKERVSHASQSKRKHSFDVVKPPGWVAPDIEGILKQHMNKDVIR